MALLLYVTVPDEAEARHIARTLVEAQLAAGVNILSGASSIYRWQGRVCEATEHILLAQVSRAAFAAVRETVLAIHSHQTPCIIALPIDGGHAPFLQWIQENSRPST